jgi:hypothetical protein
MEIGRNISLTVYFEIQQGVITFFIFHVILNCDLFGIDIVMPLPFLSTKMHHDFEKAFLNNLISHLQTNRRYPVARHHEECL